jgi:dTDP-4-dehydrorhamnose reductase
MKILILGHRGMLGSDLLNRLGLDHDVAGKDIEDFDLTSGDSCRQVIEEVMPEVVVNAAAYTNVDGAETHRDLCFAVNAEGVRNLVVACRDRKIRIVHFSTDYVFDGTKRKPYTEADVPNPLNVYGASKLQGERFLQDHKAPFLLIRTEWLYGKNGKNFVGTILEKAKTERLLKVVDDQIGSPTYTWDLAGAVKVLIDGGHAGVYHITNRGVCSWFEFTRKILQYAGQDSVTVEPITSGSLSRPALRPLFSGLSGKKFRESTGKTLRVWQMALQDFIGHPGH